MSKRLRDFFLTYFVIIFGAALSGFAVVIFLAPFNIAPAGVSGIASS